MTKYVVKVPTYSSQILAKFCQIGQNDWNIPLKSEDFTPFAGDRIGRSSKIIVEPVRFDGTYSGFGYSFLDLESVVRGAEFNAVHSAVVCP